jgi:holo-[acyl-carrier protein] synthase
MSQREPGRPLTTTQPQALLTTFTPPCACGLHLVGVGADLVDIANFERSIALGGDRWLAKMFTDLERNDAEGQIDRLATRFAAKEAVVKALGVGFRDGASPRSVEIACTNDGRPFVTLRGGAAVAASAACIEDVLISMSRDGGLAMAGAWALAAN